MTATARPLLGTWHFRRDVPTFLMVAYWDPCGITTISDYVSAWQQASRFNIAVLNLWPGSGGPLAIPSSVDLDDFDGVILHPTVGYFPSNLFNLNSRLAKLFDQYAGLKILVKQDEHVQAAQWPAFIAAKRFDVLVTCLSPSEVRKVYPREVVGDIEIVHALTGYVPPHFRELASRPLHDRQIDIGYRGSIQPLAVGRLGFEKRQVGYAVARATADKGLCVDISSRWEDRITGQAWFDFLGSSRLVLGSESGSCLFDFTGEVDRWCQDYTDCNAHLDPTGEDFYRAAHNEFLHRYEANVDCAAVSPRHFEAAAMRSIQLLYEGRYAGIFEPYRHYLPLKRDLSNLDEMLDLARDHRNATLMTEAAFDEIVRADRFAYRHFVSEVDDAIDRLLAERRPRRSISAPRSDKPRALVLMSHDPVLDPRIDWMSKGLLEHGFDVVELGTYRFTEVGDGPSLEMLAGGRARVRVERRKHDFAFAPNPQEVASGLPIGQQQLLAIYTHLTLPHSARKHRIGAIDLDHDAGERFRFFCSHFVDTNSAMLQAARQTGCFDVIVVADLDVLPAGETLAKEYGARLVYDAHEYWPHSHDMSRHWERDFWASIEGALLRETDLRLTVSPALAQRMSEDYGVEFLSVPNCEPLSATSNRPHSRRDPSQMIFLYQGSLVPRRNLENLIADWKRTDPRAILWIRGPDCSYKDELVALAETTGLLGSRIFFPAPVTEDNLVGAAAEADVGIISYDPKLPAYRYAAPNKLSQYLAAGLPLLTTELPFVAGLVRTNDLGLVCSFAGAPSLVDAVNTMVHAPDKVANWSSRAHDFFRMSYHWEAVSTAFYRDLSALVAAKRSTTSAALPLDFAWIQSGRSMRTSAHAATDGAAHAATDGAAHAATDSAPEAPQLPDPPPSLGLTILGTIPKPWRARIRSLLPEKIVSAVIARL